MHHVGSLHILLSIIIHPLNAELNPICHLLTLLGGTTIVVVSRLRVNKYWFFVARLYSRCFGITVGRTLESMIFDMSLMLCFWYEISRKKTGKFFLNYSSLLYGVETNRLIPRTHVGHVVIRTLHKNVCAFSTLNVVLERKQLDYFCSIQFIYICVCVCM